jgi:hypothetical protein
LAQADQKALIWTCQTVKVHRRIAVIDIEGAVPGDTLVVHLNRVRLNRDTAGIYNDTSSAAPSIPTISAI